MWYILLLQLALTSFYDLRFPACDGREVPMETFRGKNILIVNSASGSRRAGQLDSLAELQRRYADRLVVIVFPSNSFGREPKDAVALCAQTAQLRGSGLLVAAPVQVTGDDMHPVFRWLTSQADNEVSDSPVTENFRKYLINAEGNLVGIFAAPVQPLSSEVIQALETAQ